MIRRGHHLCFGVESNNEEDHIYGTRSGFFDVGGGFETAILVAHSAESGAYGRHLNIVDRACEYYKVDESNATWSFRRLGGGCCTY